MKKIIISTLVAATLAISAQAEDVSFGVGIGVTGVNGAVIKAPIDINKEFRIEPEIALGSVDYGFGSQSVYSIGSGFYLLNKTSEKTSLYYGGKAVFGDNISSEFSSEISAVFGFEYFMDPKVSLGAEASFGFGFGDVSGYSTNSSVNLRYYF